MPKKMIKHEKIPDEKQRNKVFKSRAEGLLKKVNELSILCGIDAAVVIHKRGENNTTLWPSPEIFEERLQKFLKFPDVERERKMVTHDKYLDHRVVDESRSLFRSQQINEILEAELVTDDLAKGKRSYEQLDLIHMNGMDLLADEMLEKLDKIIYDHQFTSEQEQQLADPSSVVMPPPVPNLSPLEDLMSWSDTWFMDRTTIPEQPDLGGIMGFATTTTSYNAMHATPRPPKN